MKLPDKENAYVPLSKLLNYLLSETHPIGKSKSKYLRSFGFNETNINLLKYQLTAIAQSEEVKEGISSPHGVKYIIDGFIKTPEGSSINMRTVWIIDKGKTHPRFVTAYPV
ncbi:MAG: hypothetical protein HY807_01330 [Nitrospirae bacterium]|nr:hypothetical protein [Nitrospirota bacterium]